MRPTVNLSEVCDFIRWITFSKSDQVETWNDFIFVATTKAAQADWLHFDDLVKVKREKLKNDETILQEWDILISIANSLNLLWRKTFVDDLKNQDISFWAFMWCLRVNRDKILPRFLSYILDWNDYKNFCISEANTTTNISNIKWSTLWLFEIPLPPLETQKAIVAKLDQIFAELDQTKSEIQNNLDNTDELWKSALNQAFQWDWEMKKLGEMATIQAWGTPNRSKKEYYEWWTIPWLKSWELNDSLCICENEEFITNLWMENSSAKLFKKWTLLMAMYWATAWKLWILNIDATTNQAVCSIQNTKWMFNNLYIFYYLFLMRDKIILDSFWWAQPNISKEYIKNIELPVPPLSEQERIVEHLDQVSKEVKALKSQYQSQLDNLEELKKSVLDKAFRWEMG